MICILIVEDNRSTSIILQNYIKKYFEEYGIDDFHIDIVSNGKKAIELLEIKSYDMIFLDVIMPKINGFDLLDFVRLKKDAIIQPYICMATAIADEENIDIFRNKQASCYMMKPYGKKMVFKVLDTYIKPFFDTTIEKEDKDSFIDFTNQI